MKEERYFYVPNAASSDVLPPEEAAHAVRVLRLSAGDEVCLMDGCGSFYKALISQADKHGCKYEIKERAEQVRCWSGHLHLAIAPTKMNERMEWLAEKATEIGIDRLSFLRCRFSERTVIHTSRIERVVLSAVEGGARVLRVHDVAGTAQAVNSYWAVAKNDARQGFISLGSNVGDRIGHLTQAVRLINEIPLTCVVQVSHAYETEPAYGIATPVVNAVAEIRTELHPTVLVEALMDVEAKLKRVRDPRMAGHGPRTIDCDLCWVEDEEHAGAKLTLPHPHLGERDYVLVPMEDLMHDPARFLIHAGVPVYAPGDRVGHVTAEIGELDWQ